LNAVPYRLRIVTVVDEALHNVAGRQLMQLFDVIIPRSIHNKFRRVTDCSEENGPLGYSIDAIDDRRGELALTLRSLKSQRHRLNPQRQLFNIGRILRRFLFSRQS
jgi:hypothetical protein